MVVALDAGREAVRAYVTAQAALGRDHVVTLVRGDRKAMAAASEGLSEEEADFKLSQEEFSLSQVFQHLEMSFARSEARLRSLSAGEEFHWAGPSARPGGLPDDEPESFSEVRRRFLEGTDAVLMILERADPRRPRDLTADHAELGPFDWLEWAVYSHHVHTHDHVGQVQALRAEIDRRRGGASPAT